MRPIKTMMIILLICTLGYGVYFLDTALPTGTGYASKYICSQTFLANRNPEVVFRDDVKPTHPLFSILSNTINQEEKSVTSAAFGFWKSMTALYREGFGCTLLVDTTIEELHQQIHGAIPQQQPMMDLEWPLGEKVNSSPMWSVQNLQTLNQRIERAFDEPQPDRLRNTHAVVVVHRGELIAERYHPQFSPQSLILGWSMSKTVTAALIGRLVKQGKLELAQLAPVPEWENVDDPRHQITLDHLLRMSSGLEFAEVYGPATDATLMLYESKSMAQYAATKPLLHPPDEVFDYSSGTTNLLARVVQETTGGTLVHLHHFMRVEFFDKIGMYTALIEPDAAGSFVGSSYMYASARDWARFGLLLLQDGIWNGEQILAQGWVDYMRTPTPSSLEKEYGGHTWLNAGNLEERAFPSLPKEMYHLSGYNEQIVAIFPSDQLIIVRLGATTDESAWDKEGFLRDLLQIVRSSS